MKNYYLSEFAQNGFSLASYSIIFECFRPLCIKIDDGNCSGGRKGEGGIDQTRMLFLFTYFPGSIQTVPEVALKSSCNNKIEKLINPVSLQYASILDRSRHVHYGRTFFRSINKAMQPNYQWFCRCAHHIQFINTHFTHSGAGRFILFNWKTINLNEALIAARG